jgi:hypothetical protein
MSILNSHHIIPLGLVGQPITEDRARELARTVATSLVNTDAIAALAELLLGIAPQENTELHEALSQRRPIEPIKADDLKVLSADLWTRYSALTEAIAVLYSFTPEFRETLEQYAWNLRNQHETEGICSTLKGGNRDASKG